MEVYKEFLVLPIDYKKKIAFISTSDVKNSWSFEVDWKFPLNDAKPKMFLENGKEENGKKPEADKQDVEELSVQSIAVSEAHNLLVFTCSDKSLFLCKISGSSAVVQSRRVFLRTMSVIKFSSCGKLLFVADKTGDTFEYSCEDVNKPARWIFGHISQILDLQINSDSSFIITSDRDEKVRVTKYPETHEIEAFCVGHKEFVSSVIFFNNEELLLSASGDKTLRFWNYRTGKQVQRIDMTFVPVTIALSERFMAISSDDNTVHIYSYEIVSAEIVKIHLLGQKTYSSDIEFTAKGENFFIKHTQDVDGQKKLQLDKVSITKDSATFEQLCDVTDTLGLKLELSFAFFKSFDVSLLFKKRYDNVKQYIDRKKARIENQEAKKK